MKLPHYVLVALSLVVVILTWVIAEQAKGDLAVPAQFLAAIVSAVKLIDTVIAMCSDSVSSGLAQKRALAAAATKVSGVILFVLALGALGGGLTACAQIQAVLPELDAIEAVVVKDLAANDTDGQIAADVCQLLGGTSTADAVCANVTNIVVDVVQTLLDSGVLGKRAPAAVERAKLLVASGHAKLALKAADAALFAVSQ